MIKQITQKCHIPRRIRSIIKILYPLKGGEWDFSKNKKKYFSSIAKSKQCIIESAIKEFKKLLLVQLRELQHDKCAYCGSELFVTSSPQIEHIAPKGGAKRPKYVKFTFLPMNLALACSFCNSPTKKGGRDTIVNEYINYSKCQFSIVHPYFDNPNDHYKWEGALITGKTNKGINTIEMFQLDGEALTTNRQKIIAANGKPKLEEELEALKSEILKYKPSQWVTGPMIAGSLRP